MNILKMPRLPEKRKKDVEIEYVIEKPKRKHRRYDAKAKAEDKQLTKILFGGARSFLHSLNKAEQQKNKKETYSEDEKDSMTKPAWTDEDDDRMLVEEALNSQSRSLPNGGINSLTNKYKNLLEHKFKFINGTHKWSDLKQTNKKEDGLLTCGFIKNTQNSSLPDSVLNFKKMRDLNCGTYNEGPFINSVKFLKNTNVALVAGQAGIASFSVVDGKKNAKLHSIQFERFPIFCAELLADDNEVIFGSRHSYIHSYDVPSGKSRKINLPPNVTTFKKCAVTHDQKIIAAVGKWGEIHLLTAKSKERIGVLKQSSEATSLVFSPNDESLYVHSDSGEVTIFDMSTRRVKHKFGDEGCLQGITIAVSSSNQFLATGSAQGIVNVYDINLLYKDKQPVPRKSIMNLTTSITCLEFNPTSEILAFSSIDCPNSVKMYHLNSSTVFKNFPSFESKLGHVNALNFSPNSGYVCFGNKYSTVSLYRLGHFKNY